jgi:hypothetical protein
LEFIIDGTERRLNRPKDKDAQKEYYSGKKKSHTVKNNVISQRRGKVVFLSDTYEGKKHDKAIRDEEDYQFPPRSKLWKDSGFQGYERSCKVEVWAARVKHCVVDQYQCNEMSSMRL